MNQKILDYAIWYYLRYYPSTKKMKLKLKEKFGLKSKNGKKYGGISEADIENIITEHMRNIIKEQEVLESKIEYLQQKGKNISYIRGNLIQKGFKKDDIDSTLEGRFQSQEKSFLEKDIIKAKILNYKKRGKSKNFIKYTFIERNLDKELIETLIEEVFSENDEKENLLYEYDKLKDKKPEKKIIETLLRRGFLYDDIKSIFKEK